MKRRQSKQIDSKPGLFDESYRLAGAEKATGKTHRVNGVHGRHHYEYAPPNQVVLKPGEITRH
jgi:hypothetical protein